MGASMIVTCGTGGGRRVEEGGGPELLPHQPVTTVRYPVMATSGTPTLPRPKNKQCMKKLMKKHTKLEVELFLHPLYRRLYQFQPTKMSTTGLRNNDGGEQAWASPTHTGGTGDGGVHPPHLTHL